MFLNILILVAVTSSFNIIPETKASAGETELVKRLIDPKTYNKDVIPQSHGNESGIELKFGIALVMIDELNTKEGYLTSSLWYRLVWNDDRLKYNGTKMPGENITVLRISATQVWKPPIQVANVYEKQPDTVPGKALVYPSGEVLWVPQVKIKSSCVIDPTYFPFDQQTCSFKFFDPFHSANEMRLSLYNNKNFIDMSDYWKSADWAIVEAPAFLNTHHPPGEPKTEDITFYITLQRKKPGPYTLTLTVPTILISFITLLTFGLPTGSNEKLITSFVSIVSLILMLIHIGNVVPPTVSSFPIITKYVLFALFLHLLSILGTTLILHLGSKESDMPDWIRETILVKLGNVVRVNPGNEKVEAPEKGTGVAKGSDNHLEESVNNRTYDAETTILTTLSKKKIQNQRNEVWQTVALILDRTSLILFLIITIIGTLVYLTTSKIGYLANEDAAIQSYLGHSIFINPELTKRESTQNGKLREAGRNLKAENKDATEFSNCHDVHDHDGAIVEEVIHQSLDSFIFL